MTCPPSHISIIWIQVTWPLSPAKEGCLCGASGKEPTWESRRCKRGRFDPWDWKIPWRRAWQPTPVSVPGEAHGRRSLAGYSLWGRKESGMTERLTHTHIILFRLGMQSRSLQFLLDSLYSCHSPSTVGAAVLSHSVASDAL